MSPKRLFLVFLPIAPLVAMISIARAWHDDGHQFISQASVKLLPADVPPFFREGGEMIGHFSIDPDVFADRRMPQLSNAEGPEHYIDYELLEGAELPKRRYDFYKWCAINKKEPRYVGTLPYALTEWTQRLTLAFAEYRQHPENEAIRMKCLVYAGILAHYATDSAMPLHTTIHYNGRVGENGQSPKTGIHGKVDALAGKIEITNADIEAIGEIKPYSDTWAAVLEQIMASREHIDRTYELEAKIPEIEDVNIEDPEVLQFTRERTRAAMKFTAELFLTAWRRSETAPLPKWLERPPKRP